MTEHIRVPCWRYHATEGAKLFITENELDRAEASGWADSPRAALEALDIAQKLDTKPPRHRGAR